MASLIETLAAELERPRELSERVLNYIADRYEVERDAIGSFLIEALPKLEDYEVDLILSPTFTPKLADQAIFAELLGSASVAKKDWPGLITELVERPTKAQLMTADGRSHTVPLREVTVERYVHRLRLDGTIPEPLRDVIERIPPAADRPLLKAIARRAVWESHPRADILKRYLAADERDSIDLLNLVESWMPADAADLMARIPARQEALRVQINAGGKPFFNQRVEELHGGGRDQRQPDAGAATKERELAFLTRLLEILQLPNPGDCSGGL